MAKLEGQIPQETSPTGSETLPPTVPPRARFLLRWHPEAWDLIGGQLLPRLGYLTLVPGTNRIRHEKQLAEAIAAQAERGWTIIPEDIRGPGTTYLRSYETKSGQLHWATEWTELHSGSDHIGCDVEGYAAFLRWLIDEGHIPAPAPHIVGRVKDRLKRELREAQDKAVTIPSYRLEVDRVQGQLDAFEASERSMSEPPAGPAPRRPPSGRKPRGGSRGASSPSSEPPDQSAEGTDPPGDETA